MTPARTVEPTIESTSDLWWKNAVFYCVDVESFMDWDGDGCGDLRGLTDRIDYLAGIGVTCLWLMPFYRSPRRDSGYDVSDFYATDPRFGSLGDFTEMMRVARDRGLRVVIDLVVNHTSAEHPWFEAARTSEASPYRDFYVWRDEPPKDFPAGPAFPGEEDDLWKYDERAGRYYLHHFYSHQPDLNTVNPEVRREIGKVIGFWLDLGVSGFRIDAVPHMIESHGGQSSEFVPHDYLRSLRNFAIRRNGEAVLLGEVNRPADEQSRFFGSAHGDECTMIFNFILNQAMFLALARADATPIADALDRLSEIPTDCQWANFVRNHDELTLDRLTSEERDEVFAEFGEPEEARIYGRGIRRRLPPMVDGDERRVRLAYSLMFSLPGAPVLLYGEEIGMGDDLGAPGRLSVRTPMQWTPEPLGGFTSAPPGRLVRKPVGDDRYAAGAVNVADQRRDPGSLLNWMERLIRRRRECPELGWGTHRVLQTGDSRVLAHRCDWEGSTILVAHNLSGKPVRVEVSFDDPELCSFIDLFGEADEEVDAEGPLRLRLGPYGFRWLRARAPGVRAML
jgi:trehalose synthase